MGETIFFALKSLFIIDVNLLSLFCVFRKEAFGTLDRIVSCRILLDPFSLTLANSYYQIVIFGKVMV